MRASTSSVYACLGDSITFGAKERSNQPYPLILDLQISPRFGAGNHGVLSDTLSQMQTRYTNNIKNKGYTGLILLGGINDILVDTTATAAYTTWNAIVTDALASGLHVIGCTPTPFHGYSSWTSGRQTQLEAFNALIMARTGPNFYSLDTNSAFGQPGNPTYLATLLDSGDGLHWGAAGCELMAGLTYNVIRETHR